MLNQLQNPGFIISFQTCRYIYCYTKGVSKQLQASTTEIIKACEIWWNEFKESDIWWNEFKESQAILEKRKDMLDISKIFQSPTLIPSYHVIFPTRSNNWKRLYNEK